MSRRKGSRNKGYQEEYERLSRLLFENLISDGNSNASFRKLAAFCDVSPATLRHYFHDRNGAIVAALKHAGKLGDFYTGQVRKGEFGSVEEALTSLLRYFHYGWEHTILGDTHRLGLGSGLGDGEVGPAYLDELLEPALQAFEARIQLHVDKGELRACNTRFASLNLLSPFLLAMLHQKELLGTNVRPMAVNDFIKEHVASFLRAYKPENNL